MSDNNEITLPEVITSFSGEVNDNKLTSKVNKSIQDKWESSDWNHIERTLSPSQIKILNELIKLATNKKSECNEELVYQVFGEQIYLSIRDLLLKHNLVGKLLEVKEETSKKEQTDKIKKPKQKHGEKSVKLSTAMKIKMENSAMGAKNETTKILASFSSRELTYTSGIQTKIVELKGVTFMYIVQFIMNRIEMYTRRQFLPQVYETIVGIQRFLDSVKLYQGKSTVNPSDREQVSETMMNDLTIWLNKLIKTFDYKGKNLCKINSKLLVESEYDKYIPLVEVKPYKNQVDLMNCIREGMQTNNGFLISYKAMTNSGKTTMAVAIATFVKMLNDAQSGTNTSRKQLIYCCNSRSVQDDVCTLFYNTSIKFGYGSVNSTGIQVVNHYSCKNDEERCAIVCSPYVASQLLKNDYEKSLKNKTESSYWLFLDEPTSDADEAENKFLIDNVNVMRYSPKWSILSSATMPNLDKLKEIIEHHQNKFPNIMIKTVYSNEIFIGCEVKSENLEYIMPHLGAKSSAELKSKIENINHVPFLGRLYTHKVVLKLYEDLRSKVQNLPLPDIDNIFADVKNLKMDNIRLVALELLQKLSNCSDTVISDVCSTSSFLLVDEVESKNNKKDNNDDDDFTFEDEQKTKEESFNKNDKLDYDLMGTYHAYKYQGNNVIFTTDPVQRVRKHFAPLLDLLKKERIESASKIFDKYDKLMAGHSKSVERIQTRTKNQTKMSQEIQDLNENGAPSIEFPIWAQVNTLEHIKKFAKTHIKELDPKMIRLPYRLENIPRNSVTTDDLMLLLMCGIGIYTQDFKQIDKIYLNQVMQMASNGHLAYIFADSSMSYGANYPVNRIFITDEFAKKHSIDTIFQSLSRAGRVGKSYMAEGFVPNSVAETILKYSQSSGSGYGDIESLNMIQTFKNLLVKEEKEKETKRKMIVTLAPKKTQVTIQDNKNNIGSNSKVIDENKNSLKTTPKTSQTNFTPLKNNKPLFTPGEKSRTDSANSWRRTDLPTSSNTRTSGSRYVPPHLRQSKDEPARNLSSSNNKRREVKDESGWTRVEGGKR